MLACVPSVVHRPLLFFFPQVQETIRRVTGGEIDGPTALSMDLTLVTSAGTSLASQAIVSPLGKGGEKGCLWILVPVKSSPPEKPPYNPHGLGMLNATSVESVLRVAGKISPTLPARVGRVDSGDAVNLGLNVKGVKLNTSVKLE